jgi:hypothetical protein
MIGAAASRAGLIAIGLALLCAPGAWGAPGPLPPSDYGLHAACARPARGTVGCLAVSLVPKSVEARAHTHPLGRPRLARAPASAPAAAGSFGLRPQDLHSAYQLPTAAVGAQTIALVDAYNDPTAESDLAAYSTEFGLPQCTAAGGCFEQVNESGEAASLPFPKTKAELEAARKGTASQRRLAEEAEGWGLEMSLDLDAAHAVCEGCRIVLVEASSTGQSDLERAERTAAALGAQEISNSWGAPECGGGECATDSPAFDHPGVVITASAGDDGYLSWGSGGGYAEYPASSPHVVAVGGTRLRLGEAGGWAGETVWNGSGAGGGGCSVAFGAQPWQRQLSDWSAVGCSGFRAVADVSADADPYSGLAVHDTSPSCRSEYSEGGVRRLTSWCTVGGTSLSSPLIAAVYALAGGADGVSYPAQTLYENELRGASLHDVTSGSNGECLKALTAEGFAGCTSAEEGSSCQQRVICVAGSGYDGPSGVGSPSGIAAFQPGAPASEQATPASSGEGGQASAPPPPAEAPAGPVAEAAGSAGAASTAAGAGSASGASSGLEVLAAPSSPPPGVSAPALRITGLRLRAHGSTARSRHPRLAFSFALNRAALVRVTLLRRVRVHGKPRWVRVARALSLRASAGRDSGALTAARPLAPGLYRLTLTAQSGSGAALLLRVG